ncbi:MAG TPA: MFS transporter [Verrucomicrobiae bacterium]|jgi:LPLT family lysophospholipid transporter-like MFS transporter
MNGPVLSAPARRNYALLLASQFWSAFADNFILMLIVGPLMFELKNGQITAQDQSVANIYYTSLLMVPYVLLAPLTGYLNDRFSKNRWLIGANFIKLLGAAAAAMSINGGKSWLAAGYFIVGIGAAAYSPAKYGILPEILPRERLVKANGAIELLTLVAILMGNIAGATAFDKLPLLTGYCITAGVYALSLGLNLLMARTPSYRQVEFKGSLGAFFHNLAILFSSRRLARVLMGTALFWVCGAVLKMNFQPWGQQVLNLKTMTEVSLLGLWLALGVMAGSVLAGRLFPVGDLRASRRCAWLLAAGIAALGSIGSLVRHGLDYPKTFSICLLALTGLMAGLFLIPLNAALQAESHKDSLGKTIALQNGFENLSMLGGSLIAYLDVKKGFNPSQLLLVLAAFVAVVAIWLKIPERTI